METKFIDDLFISEGSEAMVYDIGNNICYKYYKGSSPSRIAAIADIATTAAIHGLGPDVYAVNETGYYTEIVEVVNDCEYFENAATCYDRKCKCPTVDQCKFTKEGISELHRTLIKTFDNEYYFSDLSWFNVGVKNNKLVCIDFGIGVIPSCCY